MRGARTTLADRVIIMVICDVTALTFGRFNLNWSSEMELRLLFGESLGAFHFAWNYRSVVKNYPTKKIDDT